MGLLMLSIFASIVLSCLTWLVLGDRFPPGQADKLPTLHNIVIYAAILIVPTSALIFFVFAEI